MAAKKYKYRNTYILYSCQIPKRFLFLKILQNALRFFFVKILQNAFNPLYRAIINIKNTLRSKMGISIATKVHSSHLLHEIVDAFIVAGSECNFSQYLRAMPAP